EELPALRAEQRQIDDERVKPHRQQVLGAWGRGEDSVLPAHLADALDKHPYEDGVRVDDRESYGTGLYAHAKRTRELNRRGHRDGSVLVHLWRSVLAAREATKPVYGRFTS